MSESFFLSNQGVNTLLLILKLNWTFRSIGGFWLNSQSGMAIDFQKVYLVGNNPIQHLPLLNNLQKLNQGCFIRGE